MTLTFTPLQSPPLQWSESLPPPPVPHRGRGRQLCGGLLHRHKANRFSVYTSSNRGGMFQNSAWFREKHLQFQGLMSWTSLLVLVPRVPDPQPDV